MTDKTDWAEKIARLFHETYERLAPEFGYETREETREFDSESRNGRLMIAVCDEVGGVIAREAEARGIERVAERFPQLLEENNLAFVRQNVPALQRLIRKLKE